MKKVKIAWNKKTSSACYSQTISGNNRRLSFAWLSSPNEDAELPVLSTFTDCRESLIAGLWKTTVAKKSEDYSSSILYDKSAPTEKLLTPDLRVRILVREVSEINDPVDAFVIRAKRVLSIFEKYLKWRNTRIYTVATKCPSTKILKESIDKIKVQDYVFDFSKRWARSPELLSLYLMIVKMCQFDIWKNFNSVSVDDLKSVVNMTRRANLGHYNIIPYFTRTYQLWVPVLDSVNELFMNTTIKSNYENYEGMCGFHVFVENSDPVSEAGKKWKKIREKLKLKRVNSYDM